MMKGVVRLVNVILMSTLLRQGAIISTCSMLPVRYRIKSLYEI